MQNLTLKATPPFDLHLTASHQTYYQREFGADAYSDGTYTRALEVRGVPVLGMVCSSGSADAPALFLEIRGDDVSERVAQVVRSELSRMLALDMDVRPFYEAVRDDPFLGDAVRAMYGLHPPQTASLFEALVMAITGQQISGIVARSIRARIVRELGKSFSVNGRTVYTFPTPEGFLGAGHQRLRGLGLSARKTEYILGIASKAAEGDLSYERISLLDSQQVVEEMTRIRGVGEWTAHWVLLRALARQDAFPAGDLALRRLISEVYFDGRAVNEKEAVSFAKQQWGQYSGLATTYMFAHIRQRRVEQEGFKETMLGV